MRSVLYYTYTSFILIYDFNLNFFYLIYLKLYCDFHLFVRWIYYGLFNASNTENDILFDLEMSNPLQSAASFMEGDIDELPTPALEEEITKYTSAEQVCVTSNSKLERKRRTRKE